MPGEVPDALVANLRWRLDRHGERLREIEALKPELVREHVYQLDGRVKELEELRPEIVAERVQILSAKVDRLTGVIVKVGVGVVGSAIAFAFSVFALVQ